jgi:oxygen-dependent protoporphyrinogen oxidase
MRTIVVIGGGMSGTAAAHMLMRRGYEVTILEASDRIGGRIHSQSIGGLIAETGAGFMTGEYKTTLDFLQDAGLSDKLAERKGGSAIMRGGKPQDLQKLSVIFGSGWLSWGAKLLLLKEFFKAIPAWRRLDVHNIWKVAPYDTESISQHFTGKYGQEVLDYVFGPALDTYLYWSPDHTSYALSKALFKGTSALRQRHTYTLRGGLSQIPEAAAKGANVLLSHRVKQVYQAPSGKYALSVDTPDGMRIFTADGIVCATTATVVPKIIKGLSQRQRDFFSSVQYSSTVNVSYRLPRSDKGRTYGVGYPRKEGWTINAMSVVSDHAPDADLVKLHGPGSLGKELCRKSDKQIEVILSEGIGLDLEPARKSGEWRVQKWPEALPYFDVGYIKQLKTFMDGEIEDPVEPLTFAGDYLGGPFIDGAFVSGIKAAMRLEEKLV